MRFAVALLGAVLTGQDTTAPLAELIEQITPSPAEQEWRAIPWRPQLRDALVEADAAAKPVLLWAMNGHPLGQT